MTQDRRNDKLAKAAEDIIAQHSEILSLMATAEDRAKLIGQKLIDLKPELKMRGTNLTEFCRDYLPFGKTTAYDYIKIAQGKLSWSDHVGRGNSESSEKVASEELFYGHINFERGLATLRAMQWVNAGSDFDKWLSNIEKDFERPPEQVTYSLAVRDWLYVCMAVAQAKKEGHAAFADGPSTHDDMVRVAINYALDKVDLYYRGWPILVEIMLADIKREELLSKAMVKEAKAIAFKQEEHAKVLGMTLEDARMLAALVFNDDANLLTLHQGGAPQDHPAWKAFQELVPGGAAEEWCAEGMIMTAVKAAKEWSRMDVISSLEGMQTARKPLWLISQEAARLLADAHKDETEKRRVEAVDA